MRRSSRMSQASHKRSRSSQKLSKADRDQMAKSETEFAKQEASTIVPDLDGQVRSSSVMMIPPATPHKPPTEGKVASSDHPVINLDLH